MWKRSELLFDALWHAASQNNFRSLSATYKMFQQKDYCNIISTKENALSAFQMKNSPPESC